MCCAERESQLYAIKLRRKSACRYKTVFYTKAKNAFTSLLLSLCLYTHTHINSAYTDVPSSFFSSKERYNWSCGRQMGGERFSLKGKHETLVSRCIETELHQQSWLCGAFFSGSESTSLPRRSVGGRETPNESSSRCAGGRHGLGEKAGLCNATERRRRRRKNDPRSASRSLLLQTELTRVCRGHETHSA